MHDEMAISQAHYDHNHRAYTPDVPLMHCPAAFQDVAQLLAAEDQQ